MCVDLVVRSLYGLIYCQFKIHLQFSKAINKISSLNYPTFLAINNLLTDTYLCKEQQMKNVVK